MPERRPTRRTARGARRALQRKLQPFVALMVVVDAIMIALSVLVAARLREVFDFFYGVEFSDALIVGSAISFAVVWLVALFFRGAYDVRQVGSGMAEYAAVTRASWMAAAGIGVILFLFQATLSRGLYLISFAVGFPALLLGRWLVRRLLNRVRAAGRLRHRTLVLGAPAAVEEIVGVVRRNQASAYELVGACVPQTVDGLSVPVLGRARDVRELVSEHRIDTVLVTGGLDSAASLRRVGWALEGLDVDLVVTPSLTEVAGTRIHMRMVAGLPLVHVEEPQAGAASGLRKRAFDVTVASTLLVLGAPVFALVALLIKLEDRGPVFFRQQRAGRDGEDFGMIKFRSMVPDAEDRLGEVSAGNEVEGGVLFKSKQDHRITRVGSVLRKFSLDELPQLLNVVMGDMSLVGPRPPLGSEVAQYADDHHRRLLVRPGMTGLWQVSGRSDLSWDESVRLDLYYVDNWSLAGDLMIMLRTVRAVAAGRGAY
ncbi:sugar transferase [Nocardioidaceae bacterium]|nr:sugar transferase [Nocardioidaceae bacterium]